MDSVTELTFRLRAEREGRERFLSSTYRPGLIRRVYAERFGEWPSSLPAALRTLDDLGYREETLARLEYLSSLEECSDLLEMDKEEGFYAQLVLVYFQDDTMEEFAPELLLKSAVEVYGHQEIKLFIDDYNKFAREAREFAENYFEDARRDRSGKFIQIAWHRPFPGIRIWG